MQVLDDVIHGQLQRRGQRHLADGFVDDHEHSLDRAACATGKVVDVKRDLLLRGLAGFQP
jgi:hypothetical protein